MIGAEPQPLTLTHVGEWPGHLRLGPNAEGIVMSGIHGYVGFAGAISIIDFREPENPVFLDSIRSEASSLNVEGGFLYEAGLFGLRVLDISNPEMPSPLGTVATATRAFGVAVSGRFAYVTAGQSGFYVIDIENPGAPTITGRLENNGGGRRVELSGGYAYVTAWSGSAFEVIDISDPTKPALVKAVATASSPWDIDIVGNYAYVAGTSLEIFDISDPINPIARGKIALPRQAMDVEVWNGRAYVAAEKAGLHLYEVSDSENPTHLGQYDTDGKAAGVWLQGDYVYVAADTSGAQVIDFSDPADPRLVGVYETGGYSRGIAISKGPAVGIRVPKVHAFIAEDFPSMRSVNVTDPQRPVLADTLDGEGSVPFASHIAIIDDYAYLLGSSLVGVSIENPANLVRAGTGGQGQTVVASGNYLYLPTAERRCSNGQHPCLPFINEGGFLVYEVLKFPGHPEYQGKYLISGIDLIDVRAWDIAVAGNYAYVAHAVKLAVVDVTDPKAPVAVGELPLECRRIAIAGDYAYVLGHDSTARQLSVVDVRNPTAPEKVWEGATQGFPNSMVVSGRHLYLSSSNLVEVFDLSDPKKPVAVASGATKGDGEDLAVEGNYIYVADGRWGLQIFRLDLAIELEAKVVGNEFRVRWPAETAEVVLQSTASLRTPHWQEVLPAPVLKDGFYEVVLPSGGPAGFFRLQQP